MSKTLWAIVVIAPDHRAFAVETDPATWPGVVDELKPRRWRETAAGIYRVEFNNAATIIKMERLRGLPGNDAAPEPEPDAPQDGPRAKVADDYAAIAKAMKSLGKG